METEIFMKKLGKTIAKIRTEKKLSHAELGRLMDLPRQNIYRLETGTVNPRAKTLYDLAKVLDVSVADLMKF